jgi:hypothetical protein
MDQVQSVFNNVLFPDKFPPPTTAHSSAGSKIHEVFWSDAYNRNLRLEHVEVEVRMGRAPVSGKGPFDTNVPERMFRTFVTAMQSYTGWDSVTYNKQVVGYFPAVDESMRLVKNCDGSSKLISKQKVLNADFRCPQSPLDMRMAVSVEIPLTKPNVGLNDATRTVVRERHSFALNSFRYDLTALQHADGSREFQVEIELIDPRAAQIELGGTAQKLTIELQNRLLDLFRMCEESPTLSVELLRKRYF